MYDIEHGKVSIQDWGKHLLQYYDGQFLEDSLIGLFLYNTIQRHARNREGIFFFFRTDLLEEIHQQFKNC
jgi:hypothetical protein